MTEQITDDEIQKLEEELKELEDKGTASSDSPKSKDKDNQYKFFRDILTLRDTTRVGNLQNMEMGAMKLGVRHYQEIANYAQMEGLHKVYDYLMVKSQIVTATSMSKKGFWSELFMTQIKREKKDKAQDEKKRGLFSGKPKEEGE